MKKKLINYGIFLCVHCCSYAQTSNPDYQIAPWLNDKKAAVSLTFDDGIVGQFTMAIPALNAYHFKGTFFVTTKIFTQQSGNWQLIKDAALAGHEIASHAVTHPHFITTSADTIDTELIESNKIIDGYLHPGNTITHAYPFGEGGGTSKQDSLIQAITKKYFIGARATRVKPNTYNRYDFAVTADDYFKVNSDMIADSASMADFGKQLDQTILAGGWYVPTYHGIETDWIITPLAIFKQHLAALEKRKEDLWITTFAEALKYHRERNSAKLTTVSDNDKEWQLALTDTLNNTKIWNQPLTIHLKTGLKKITNISQEGKSIPYTIHTGEIIFNAVPGKAFIVIKK